MPGSDKNSSGVAGVPTTEAQDKAQEQDRVLIGDGGEEQPGEDEPGSALSQISKTLSGWANDLREDRRDENIDVENARDAHRRGNEILSDYSSKFEVDRDRREDWQEEMKAEFQPVFEQINEDFRDVSGSMDPYLVWEFTDSNHLPEDYGFDFSGGALTHYLHSATSQIEEHEEQLENYNEQLGELLEEREERKNQIEIHENEKDTDLGRVRDTGVDIDAETRNNIKEVVESNTEGRIEAAREELNEFEQGPEGDEIRNLLEEMDREERERQEVVDPLERTYSSITEQATEVAGEGLGRTDELLARAEAYTELIQEVEDISLTETAPLGVDTGVPELKRQLSDVVEKTVNRAVEISEEVESAAEFVDKVEDIIPDEVSEGVAAEIESGMSELVDRYSDEVSYEGVRDLVDEKYGSIVDLGPLDAIHDQGIELEKKREEYTE